MFMTPKIVTCNAMSMPVALPLRLGVRQLLVLTVSFVTAHGLGLPTGVTPRFFFSSPKFSDTPKLILISGPPGTGKSTFGMSVALDQGIIKCISTDTVRAVMRSFVGCEISPALHRSSYAPAGENDDPVRSWKETCTVLKASVEGLIDDAIHRGQSLVVEGVHVVPSTGLIQRWEKAGGVALGCLLKIDDSEAHIGQLRRRGFLTGKLGAEEQKINSFDRIRAIQDEMIRLAEESNWLLIEQRIGPDPLELVSSKLWEEGCNLDASGIYKIKQKVAIGEKETQSEKVSKEEKETLSEKG